MIADEAIGDPDVSHAHVHLPRVVELFFLFADGLLGIASNSKEMWVGK